MNLLKKFLPVSGWFNRVKIDNRFITFDSEIKKVFSKQPLDETAFIKLFEYFIEGIDAYHIKGSSTVDYPGVPGSRGHFVEGIEGFARSGPLLAGWLYSGRSQKITLSSGAEFDLFKYLKKVLVEGTDTRSVSYWGKIEDFDQKAVEAGDIAVTYQLLKYKFPSAFSLQEHQNIRDWLAQINKIKLYGGNWCLFPLIINCVLSENDIIYEQDMFDAYNEFKSFHLGSGWFGDGKDGIADYYNAWQFYYFLFWFNKFRPEHDTEFIKNCVSEFSKTYVYFFSSEGFPIFGRSVSYRTALPLPLIVNVLLNDSGASTARRALELIWSHFIKMGALQGGVLSQGYYGNQPHLLENYSGRASPLWGLRSLTLAFLNQSDSKFWLSTPEPLPIEKGSFDIKIDGPNFHLTGDHKTKRVSLKRVPIFHNDNSSKKINNIGAFRSFMQIILRRPLRSDNLHIKYGRSEYSSDDFFCD